MRAAHIPEIHMMPSWESLKEAWPVILAVAGLWGRLEVALSRGRALSEGNARDIERLDHRLGQVEANAAVQAIQLGRIEEKLDGQGRMLDRIDRKIQ